MTDGPYPGKRAFDLTVLAIVALPALVIGGICAIAVRLTSGSPVLYRQDRVGWNGASFRMLKLRTMTVAGDDGSAFPDPERITRIGGWLRRLSLDELPQLLHVLRGEMSIVGPRPTLAYQVERYDDRQRRRLAVRPGLTGAAQVAGRNLILWTQRIEYDVEYVETQSVRTDLVIVLRTPMLLLRATGVIGHPTDDPMARPAADDPATTPVPAPATADEGP